MIEKTRRSTIPATFTITPKNIPEIDFFQLTDSQKNKIQLINKICDLFEISENKRAISRELNLHVATVRKYIKTPNQVDLVLSKRNRVDSYLYRYEEKIIEMVINNIGPKKFMIQSNY